MKPEEKNQNARYEARAPQPISSHRSTHPPSGFAWRSALPSVALVGAGLLAASCIRMPTIDATPRSTAEKEGGLSYGAFKLKADFDGPCARADVVDVDLGHTPESFVRA